MMLMPYLARDRRQPLRIGRLRRGHRLGDIADELPRLLEEARAAPGV